MSSLSEPPPWCGDSSSRGRSLDRGEGTTGASRAAYRGSNTGREGDGRGTQILRSTKEQSKEVSKQVGRVEGRLPDVVLVLASYASSSSSSPILEPGEYSVAGVDEYLSVFRSAGEE